MSKTFSAEFFAGNRAKLRQRLDSDSLMVFTANGQLQKGGDVAYPFQQDASFWYLCGLDEPGMILVMDVSEDYLILPEASNYRDMFDGQPSEDLSQRQSGIKTILGAKEGWQRLKTKVDRAKQLAILAPSPPYIEVYGLFTNPARTRLKRRLKSINSKLEFIDVRSLLSGLRMVKQPIELTAMQQAINLTSSAITELKAKLPKLKVEYEAEAEITGFFLRHGAKNAWQPIVASGVNACVIHATSSDSKFTPNGLIVVDVGAEINHYCADITRTLSVDNKPSKRAQEVFNAVLEVSEFALSLQKPGALVKENEKAVANFMGETLRSLNLIKTIDSKSVRHYFPHATSHFLGLDPHDAGDYNQPLVPGTVLTVEPGIYIPEEGIGVRIEDDILITPSGHKNLSGGLSHKL
ncbi:MAG TPA: Xaa-Pro aminopeptidase [Candidatus Binatia bacterium]|nr:Xaa-Pro aminopeptidase [Candidatus Binatia bacterium]